MNDQQKRNSGLHLLWDASVIIPYYVPSATKNNVACDRSRIILDAVRHHRLDAFCYIPNIVVAEVFVAFDRQCYSGWDPQIYRNYGGKSKTLHGKKYKKAREKFRRDIHNGALFYQYDLNRYHILALDLIAPVDKYKKFYRNKEGRSMGASDLLIGAMGIHLAKVHRKDNFVILTADRRMDAIFGKACPRLNENTTTKLGLTNASRKLGFGKWSPEIYPQILDLERAKESQLGKVFGAWPLDTRKTRGKEPKA